MSAAVLTRRAALTGAVASIAAVGVAAATVAAPFTSAAPTGVSPELSALIAADAAAQQACDDYSTNVYEPLFAAAAAQANALPHATATIHGKVYSTASLADIGLSRAIVAGGRKFPDARESYRDHRSFTAAAKRRERNAARIWRHTGADAADAVTDKLSEAWADAQSAVAAHPVSTAADLHAKVAFMVKHQMFDGTNWGAELLADAARLAKMEG